MCVCVRVYVGGGCRRVMVWFVGWVSGNVQVKFCAFLCFSRVHCIFLHCVCVSVCLCVCVCVSVCMSVCLNACVCLFLPLCLGIDGEAAADSSAARKGKRQARVQYESGCVCFFCSCIGALQVLFLCVILVMVVSLCLCVSASLSVHSLSLSNNE